MAMAAGIGLDGLPQDVPAITYSEQVLEEKEHELRKYIQDNYSKIRSVEKELAELTFQKKLTAGSKKAALEHLRKKIEISGEKIRKARLKEEQARTVWEAAQKALKDEEDEKERLCTDLKRLVEDNASEQLTRLEELKRKLEALKPEAQVPAAPVPASKGQVHQQHESLKDELPRDQTETNNENGKTYAGPNGRSGSKNRGGRNGRIQRAGRGSLALQNASGWTGAGFDVENLE